MYKILETYTRVVKSYSSKQLLSRTESRGLELTKLCNISYNTI